MDPVQIMAWLGVFIALCLAIIVFVLALAAVRGYRESGSESESPPKEDGADETVIRFDM